MPNYDPCREDKVAVERLTHRHKSMARDMVVGGLTNADLIRIYGMSPGQISIIVNSPVFMVECERIRGMMDHKAVDLRDELLDLVPQSRLVLSEALHNKATPQKLAVDTAFGVLKLVAPKDGGGELHLHKHEHYHEEVSEASNEELRDDVFDLVKVGDKGYGF